MPEMGLKKMEFGNIFAQVMGRAIEHEEQELNHAMRAGRNLNVTKDG
jgi:hypothetical protein